VQLTQNASSPQQRPEAGCLLKAKLAIRGYASLVGNDLVEQIVSQLREDGARVTTARRLVLTILVDARGHMTADDLLAAVHEQAPDIHGSTVYRNLDELERLGVVIHSHLGHGAATYSLATRAHAHLVCERCDTSFEAPEDLVAAMARGAKRRLGFVMHPYHFAVLGICADCARAETAAPAEPESLRS
jgi:Fur family ferric uptake transcriptional regulator